MGEIIGFRTPRIKIKEDFSKVFILLSHKVFCLVVKDTRLYLIILAVSLYSIMPCFAQETTPEFKFEKKIIKYDKVKEGKVLYFDYIFENVGDRPLIITDIKVTCGCTKPEWKKAPVMPGKRDTIHVSFDTKGKIGWQDRVLEVYSNDSNSPIKLRFKGMVDNKPEKQ